MLKVAIYKNLRNGLYSVQSREKDNYGLVIAHIKSITVYKPSFIVREKGREKVIEERRKNVHVFIVGYVKHNDLTNVINELCLVDKKRTTYNPYENKSCMLLDKGIKKPIAIAEECCIDYLQGVYTK